MAREKKVRRFDPRYGVSHAAIEAEAEALAREVKDYQLLSLSDLDARRADRHANAKHCWEELQLRLCDLPEREQKTIHCLLFRDIHHILELYLTHLQSVRPEGSALSLPVAMSANQVPSEFTEWLFDPKPGKEGCHVEER